MKLPSIPYLAEAFAGVLRRFPLVMLAAATGVVAAMILIKNGWQEYDSNFVKILMTAVLGLSLFLSAAIAAEKWKLEGLKKWMPSLAAAILILVYYLTLRIGENGPGEVTMMRFAGLVLAAHLLIAFLPYLDETPVADFWEYNKRLFGNFMVGAFYSLVLYAGLSIAILAVDNLFNLNINDDIYGHLFVLIAGIFNTAFFLANFPQEFAFDNATGNEEAELPATTPYTAAFKNLTKFILIPIVGIYFLILYAYSAKILVTWELPHGWVGSLVLGFSVAGIFTYLLNYMLVRFDGNSLVSNYRKWFFYVLLPMVALLFTAIGRRLSDYGVTEARFVVASAGVWLLLISVYFIISKKDNIKFIPLSLSVFALLTVLGPFSAFKVSERSQVHRLEAVLVKNNMLVDGKAVPARDSLSGTDAENIRSILHYLRQYEHFDKVASWFGAPAGKTPDWSEMDKIISDLNIGFAVATTQECYAAFPVHGGIDLEGFEKMFTVYANEPITADTLMEFSLSKDRKGFDIFEKGKQQDHFDLQPYLQGIAGKYDCIKDQFKAEDALFKTAGVGYEAKFITQNMNFEKGENFKIMHWNGIVLLKKKE